VTKRLLYLNGIAIFAVILFHATGWGMTAMFSWTHRYLAITGPDFDPTNSAAYFVLRFFEQLVVFSIPAFLFVSGFFIAFLNGRKDGTLAWKTVISRVKYLVIPYLLWSLLLIAADTLQGKPLTPVGVMVSLLTGSTSPAYYFVPLLIQFYLLSPLLVPLAKKYALPLLIVTGLMQVAVHLIQYPLLLGSDLPIVEALFRWFPKWFFPVRLFWFCAGIVVGLNLMKIKDTIVRLRPLWLAGTGILLAAGFIEWEMLAQGAGMRETVVDMFYAGFFILALLSLVNQKMPLEPQLSDLGSKSFGIYLVHIPVMELFSRAVYHLTPSLLAYQLLLVLVLIVLGLGVPLLLMKIVRKSPLQTVYSYIFG
jgi:probable poly-beta-1,6-N-acetyl-D-glucosamine export protein